MQTEQRFSVPYLNLVALRSTISAATEESQLYALHGANQFAIDTDVTTNAHYRNCLITIKAKKKKAHGNLNSNCEGHEGETAYSFHGEGGSV